MSPFLASQFRRSYRAVLFGIAANHPRVLAVASVHPHLVLPPGEVGAAMAHLVLPASASRRMGWLASGVLTHRNSGGRLGALRGGVEPPFTGFQSGTATALLRSLPSAPTIIVAGSAPLRTCRGALPSHFTVASRVVSSGPGLGVEPRSCDYMSPALPLSYTRILRSSSCRRLRSAGRHIEAVRYSHIHSPGLIPSTVYERGRNTSIDYSTTTQSSESISGCDATHGTRQPSPGSM